MASPLEEFEARLTGPWCDIGDHLQYLRDTVLAIPGAQVIELGVREGNSTSALLSAVQEVGGHMWSCDLAAHGTHGTAGPVSFPAEWLELPEWTFIVGDSASDEVLAQMPGEADVIFADTDHVYEHTLAELEAYVPRLKPGGVLLQHDTQARYTPSGPREWTATPQVEGEVARAMDDYCEKHGLSWANRHSEAGFYGLGVLRIPAKAGQRTPRTRPRPQ